MITFKNILQEYTNGRRSKPIESIIDSKKYVGYDLKDMKKASSIYRTIGLSDNLSDYYFIQPSQYERESANTANFYTLLIDNSKYWAKYPKRSKSIICLVEKRDTNFLKDEYRIYPKLNARIGVCPDSDFWYSFKVGLEKIGSLFENGTIYMNEFNQFLNLEFKIKRDDSYYNIVNKINNYILSDRQKKSISKFKTLYEYIDYCLSPKLNGFQLMKYNDNFKIKGSKEIWTDADSLLVRASL
jgi:hypothetical protein